MNILQIAHSFPPHSLGGAEIYTFHLCSELAKKHNVSVFHRVCEQGQEEYRLSAKRKEDLSVYTINNTFKHCYSFKGLYCNSSIDIEFEEILKKINPDVVHIQHLIFLSIGIIEKIKKYKIPIIFTLHDYWLICPQWHYLKNKSIICNNNNELDCLECVSSWLYIHRLSKRIYHFLKRKFIKNIRLIKQLQDIYTTTSRNLSNSKKTINMIEERRISMREICNEVEMFLSPSEFLREKFIEFGIPERKILLVKHGINETLFANCGARKEKGRLIFGFIGTILPAKGLHILIEAFNKLNHNDKSNLRIYGKLYPYNGFEYYPEYIKKIGLNNQNIHFMGNFDNQKIGEILSEVDILVIPSIWLENAPLTIQEAFCAKVPVIASRIGGIPEIVTDSLNGLLFNLGDTDDLAEKIKFVIDNPGVISKFKGNIPEIKNIAENAQEIEELYISLISKNK